uniref:Uncharacterized protein n=1 Tax=Anopheles albimanus TaxID=7167 RepID=A0A182FCF8_ANOAL
KSNSVAHLVENEAPLSTTGNVSTLSGVEDTTTTTILLDDDGIELEATTALTTPHAAGTPDDPNNPLNGSYTNLFRDPALHGAAGQSSTGNKLNYGNLMMNDCDKIQSADEIINVSELMMVCSVSGHENVYSNIPPAQVSPSGSAVGLLSPKRTSQGSSNLSAIELGSIPNGGHHHQQHQQQQQQHQQHVYSNVTSATASGGHLPDFQSSQAQTTGASSGMISSSSSHQQLTAGTQQQPHHIESPLADPALLSSSFIGNDLDLDDPVLTSSFATPKPSIPTGAVKASQLLTPSERSTESTMIDTALDLDSLDGSIGNHSQSCLVKTAIV